MLLLVSHDDDGDNDDHEDDSRADLPVDGRFIRPRFVVGEERRRWEMGDGEDVGLGEFPNPCRFNKGGERESR